MPIKHLSWGMGRMRRLAGGADAPTFVSATTNEAGTIITVTFSKAMADPTGKHAQFTVNDGSSNAVTAVALNATTTKIDLTLTNAIEYGDTVTVAYTKGTVASADTGVLASFEAQSVTNAVPEPSPYQQWNGFPDSVELLTTYPYQCVVFEGYTNTYRLCLGSQSFYNHNRYDMYQIISKTGSIEYYTLVDGVWSNFTSSSNLEYDSVSSPGNVDGHIVESNADIYDENTMTVYFAKTT